MAVIFWGYTDRNTAQRNLARMSIILSLGRKVDHVISDFLSSLDFCGIFGGFPGECNHFPTFLPDPFLSPA